MHIFNSIEEVYKKLPRPIVTMGNFDGVHRGHQALFREAIERARQIEGTAVALTFQPHPVTILRPDIKLPQLTPLEIKKKLITLLGMDALIIQPFSRSFANIEAKDFVRDFIVRYIAPKAIIVGENFRFGKDAKGDINFLKAAGKSCGFQVGDVDPITDDNHIISSSSIRKDLQNAHFNRGVRFLGRPYLITGTVIDGHKRGRKIGFPTANIETQFDIIPANGIYAAMTSIRNETFQSVVNIGIRPTFQGKNRTIEVHIFDFNQNIYGETLSVYLCKRLREERKYDSLEKLIAQIKKDAVNARDFFKTSSPIHLIP